MALSLSPVWPRNLNPTEAKDMFISTLRWRDSFDVGAAMKEEFPDEVFGKLGKVHGKDKEGHPVTYVLDKTRVVMQVHGCSLSYNLYGANSDLDAVFGDVQRFLR